MMENSKYNLKTKQMREVVGVAQERDPVQFFEALLSRLALYIRVFSVKYYTCIGLAVRKWVNHVYQSGQFVK